MALENILKFTSPAYNLFKTTNPHKEALPFLNAIPQFGKDAYQKYINQGTEAFKGLPDYQGMAQNPMDFYNKIAEGYQPSTAYQNRFEQGMRALDATSAAGGYRGTQDDQRSRGELLNKLMGEDFQNFLANILGIQGTGAAGLENQVGRGYDASSAMADYLGSANLNLANSAFQGRAGQNANKYALLNALIGAAGQAAGAYMGAGGMGSATAGTTAPRTSGTPTMNVPPYKPLNSMNSNFFGGF